MHLAYGSIGCTGLSASLVAAVHFRIRNRLSELCKCTLGLPKGRCPRVLRGMLCLGILVGFSVGSQSMNIFKKLTRIISKIIVEKDAEKDAEEMQNMKK